MGTHETRINTALEAPRAAKTRGADPNDSYTPAIDHHAQALIARIQRDHRDVDAVHALAEHYELHGDLPSLANLMEGWANTLRDDRKAAEASLRAARAVLRGLRDDRRAEMLYERALERAPELEPAMLELEVLLRDRGDDVGLERYLSRTVETLRRRNGDPKLRARVHERLGELYERSLRLPGRAITHYRAALELDGGSTTAIIAAREIYLRTGKPEAVADMYDLEIAATPSAERKLVLLRALAEHHHEVRKDLDGAVLALRRLLKLAPADIEALERLAALLRERGEASKDQAAGADRARAAEIYFQIARNVPRAQARASLDRCLALQPEHGRALAMVTELEAFGAPGGPELLDPEVSQAELDRRATGRYTPATARRMAADSHLQPAMPRAQGIDPQAEELAAWLGEEDLELIEEEVGPQNMVSLSDRPPSGSTPRS